MDATRDLTLETRRRVRRHMITSIGGIVLALLGMLVAGALSVVIFGSPPPAWAPVLPMLGILAIPAIGFYSTYTNLRCPACERSIAFQVSAKYSLFSAMAPSTCRHCGATIFGSDTPRRVRRTLIVAVALGFVLGLLSIALGMASR